MGFLKKETRDDTLARQNAASSRREGRREFYQMTAREKAAFMAAMAKGVTRRGAVKAVVSSTGVITNRKAFQAVGTFKTRIRKGLCPACGRTPEKRGRVCNGCMTEVSKWPSIHEVQDSHYAKNLPGVPDGTNLLGVVYCINGHNAQLGADGQYWCREACR